MDGQRAVVVLLGMCLALAGCSSNHAKAAGGSATSSVTPDSATATIQGLVLDQELVPIQGAGVSVSGPQAANATTDVGGAFTLDHLAPGTYKVFAQRLGYVTGARQVEAPAGNVTKIGFTLAAIAFQAEGYHVSLPHTSFIQFGNGLVAGALQFIVPVNASTVVGALCDSCRFTLYVQPKPVQVVTEVHWVPPTVTGTNEKVEIWYFLTNGTTYLDRDYELAYLSNNGAKTWNETSITKLKKIGQISVELIAQEEGVSYQHRVETWTTFAYVQPLVDGFSAFPRK
jgi:hypothetical protein